MKINHKFFPILEWAAGGIKPGGDIKLQFTDLREEYRFKGSSVLVGHLFLLMVAKVKRYFLAEKIAEKINTSPKLRKQMVGLVHELPGEEGILMFGQGGYYAYTFRKTADGKKLIFIVLMGYREMFAGCEAGYVDLSVPTSEETNVVWDNESCIYGKAFFRGQGLIFCATFLLFLRFAETEHVVVGPKQRRGYVGKEKYFNETPLDVKIIDSSWFTEITTSEGFEVEGHFKMQAYGPNWSQKRLIYINDFKKKGYTRRAKKNISTL